LVELTVFLGKILVEKKIQWISVSLGTEYDVPAFWWAIPKLTKGALNVIG
jgi:hypothetical protein